MHTFRDTTGRIWSVRIDVTAIKRVRGLTSIDLLTAATVDGLGSILSDPVKVCDILYALCRDEATARGVSDEDFGRALFGDEIETAMDALAEELIDFFPSSSRGLLRKWLAAVKKVQARLAVRADKEMEQLDPEAIADEIVNGRLMSGKQSTASPVWPESTLAD